MSWTRRKQLLGELLIELGLITTRQLAGALAEQRNGRERIGETLLRLGLIERRQLAAALAQQYFRNLVGAVGVTMLALQPGIAAAGTVRGQMTVSATVVRSSTSETHLVGPIPAAGKGATAAVTLACNAAGPARVAIERGRFDYQPANGNRAGEAMRPSYVMTWQSNGPPVTCSSAPQSILAAVAAEPHGAAAGGPGQPALSIVITY